MYMYTYMAVHTACGPACPPRMGSFVKLKRGGRRYV